MKVILISMPDVTPIIVHEMALHMPNHGIASVGGNIDKEHEVYLIDLVRKRCSIKKYLTKVIGTQWLVEDIGGRSVGGAWHVPEMIECG